MFVWFWWGSGSEFWVDHCPLESPRPQRRGHTCDFPFLATLSPLPESRMVTAGTRQALAEGQARTDFLWSWGMIPISQESLHPTPRPASVLIGRGQRDLVSGIREASRLSWPGLVVCSYFWASWPSGHKTLTLEYCFSKTGHLPVQQPQGLAYFCYG